MKVPYWVQGALFVPVFMGIIFTLHLSCPANAEGCFGDTLSVPLLMPAAFLSTVGEEVSFFAQYELLLILFYWVVVGLLIGFAFDLHEDKGDIY